LIGVVRQDVVAYSDVGILLIKNGERQTVQLKNRVLVLIELKKEEINIKHFYQTVLQFILISKYFEFPPLSVR
jgi:lipopolysaccharide biosynthesis glycosyltransferase